MATMKNQIWQFLHSRCFPPKQSTIPGHTNGSTDFGLDNHAVVAPASGPKGPGGPEGSKGSKGHRTCPVTHKVAGGIQENCERHAEYGTWAAMSGYERLMEWLFQILIYSGI